MTIRHLTARFRHLTAWSRHGITLAGRMVFSRTTLRIPQTHRLTEWRYRWHLSKHLRRRRSRVSIPRGLTASTRRSRWPTGSSSSVAVGAPSRRGKCRFRATESWRKSTTENREVSDDGETYTHPLVFPRVFFDLFIFFPYLFFVKIVKFNTSLLLLEMYVSIYIWFFVHHPKLCSSV